MNAVQSLDDPEPDFFKELVAKDIELYQRAIEDLRWEDVL